MKVPRLIVQKLKESGIGILPTDTIYGLVGTALSKEVVQRIFKTRKRNPKKPLIILISSIRELSLFHVSLNEEQKDILEKVWPGRVSVILPCRSKEFSYLHRGKRSLAFRMPKKKLLREIIKKTGPLVAPSANPEGLPPAVTTAQAKKYFGSQVDFYLSGGTLKGSPSTVIFLEENRFKIVRIGSVSESRLEKLLK